MGISVEYMRAEMSSVSFNNQGAIPVSTHDKRIIKHRFIFILLFLFLMGEIVVSGMLYAGPPYVTDDPETLEYRHWEVYYAAQFNYSKGYISGSAPQLDLNYGLLPDVQLNIVAPGVYIQKRGKEIAIPHASPLQYAKTYWSPVRFGYGETEIALKVRFVHETDKVPQLTVYPRILPPTGSKGMGYSGLPQAYFPLYLQKSWDKLTTYGGGGFWYNPGKNNKHFWFAGWSLQYKITDIFELGGELFYYSPDTKQAGHRVGGNIGMVIDLTENWHFLYSVGRDIKGPNILFSYLSIQMTY